MPAKLNGDYSGFPDAIRSAFPYLVGETLALREAWELFSHLFMKHSERTRILGDRLGPLLGVFQRLLQDELLSSIARLTDKDSRNHENLSIWQLARGVSSAKGPDFSATVASRLNRIETKVQSIRLHRHKRIAHFDMAVSLESQILPVVTFREIREVIEEVEGLLNEFYDEFQGGGVAFDVLEVYSITDSAFVTVLKAIAYDALEKAGFVERFSWRKYANLLNEAEPPRAAEPSSAGASEGR